MVLFEIGKNHHPTIDDDDDVVEDVRNRARVIIHP